MNGVLVSWKSPENTVNFRLSALGLLYNFERGFRRAYKQAWYPFLESPLLFGPEGKI